jgi:hypothetical protein
MNKNNNPTKQQLRGIMVSSAVAILSLSLFVALTAA